MNYTILITTILKYIWILFILPLSVGTSEQRLRIIAYATDSSLAHHLSRFTKQYGLDLTLIGNGDNWYGLNTKIIGYHKYLQSKLSQFNNNDIILMLDAYDTITICDQDTFLDKFNSFQTDIIMSTDKTCWPDPNLQNYLLSKMNQTFKSLHPWFPYFVCINSGAIIGKYSAILSMVEIVYKFVNDANGSCPDFEGNQFNTKTQSDQRCYSTFYVKWLNGELNHLNAKTNVSIKLDHRHSLFATLGGMLHYEYDITINENETRFVNVYTNESGCVLHGNGPGVIVLRSFIEQILNNGKLSLSESILRMNYDLFLGLLSIWIIPWQRLSHLTSKYLGFKLAMHSSNFDDNFMIKLDAILIIGLILLRLFYARSNLIFKHQAPKTSDLQLS